MSESNQRSKTLIRELYALSESGALDNIDSETAEVACDFIKNFIDPIVSYRQAAKITGKSVHAIHCILMRSYIAGGQRYSLQALLPALHWRLRQVSTLH